MTTTPRLGITQWEEGQAMPESTGNEAVRALEQGAGFFIVLDKDLTSPPGSPAQGEAYIVGPSATGAWSGHDDDIAFYLNTAWAFITPIEGARADVNDEDVTYRYSGSAWAISLASVANETIDDRVASLLVAGTGITLTYNDAANTLTIDGGAGYTDEQARDAIGAALVAGTGVSVTVNDGADTITLASTITQYTDENAMDAVAAMLTAGTGISLSYNDASNTFTITNTAPSAGSYTDENARDAIGAALVAGTGITVTVNDGADTITLASTITQYTDEMAQDAVGALLADSSTIDVTYNDAGNVETIDVIRSPQIQSVTSSATVTPTFSNDQVNITAQAAGLSPCATSSAPSPATAGRPRTQALVSGATRSCLAPAPIARRSCSTPTARVF